MSGQFAPLLTGRKLAYPIFYSQKLQLVAAKFKKQNPHH